MVLLKLHSREHAPSIFAVLQLSQLSLITEIGGQTPGLWLAANLETGFRILTLFCRTTGNSNMFFGLDLAFRIALKCISLVDPNLESVII